MNTQTKKPGRPKKENALTVAERAKRHRDKLKKFGLNTVCLHLTDTECGLLDRLVSINQCSGRKDLITDLLFAEGEKYGITLKDIKRELDEKADQKRHCA